MSLLMVPETPTMINTGEMGTRVQISPNCDDELLALRVQSPLEIS